MNALNDADEYVRGYSAYALGKVVPIEGGAVDGLIRRLNDESEEVTLFAIRALSEFRENAKPAIPALRKLAQDYRFANDAERALKRICK